MLNNILGNLNKYNPYVIENVANKNYVQTFIKMESLSMVESQSKKDRTSIANQQIQSIINQAKSVAHAYDSYWNSQIRTLISFEEFTEVIKERFQHVDYQVTLDWVGEIRLDTKSQNYYFKPFLLKMDQLLFIDLNRMNASDKELPSIAVGKIRFSALNEQQVQLIDL